MAFDRSKYLGGSRRAQAEKQNTAQKFDRRSGGTGGSDPWHRVGDGKNIFRIAPPHEPEDSAYEVYRTTTLECMKPIYKDGVDTGERELGRKRLVSAMVHHDGLAKLGVMGDPVELYVKIVKDVAFKTITDPDERKKFLAPVNGFRGQEKKWVWGIEPKTSFLAYAWDEEGTLGKLELNKGWISDIDRIADELEEDGVPLEIDPFSNPVEGYPLLITRSKNEAGKTEYLIGKDDPSRAKKETWDMFFKRTAITDEQLEELDGKKPLAKGYTNSYGMKDFEYAMDGLKRFDGKYGFGVLDTDEFQDAIAIIKETLDASTETSDDAQPEKTKVSGEATPTAKKAPAAKKAAPKKAAEPTAEEKTAKVAEYITAVYGEEYVPQIPDGGGLNIWFKIVLAEEADGDLPLEAIEEMAEEATPEEVDQQETVEQPMGNEVSGTQADKLREQMENLRKNRR